jgi:NAD-dependent DNA ligase
MEVNIMGCGGCGKKKGVQINRNVVAPKSRSVMPQQATRILSPVSKKSVTMKPQLQSILNDRQVSVRCPICTTVLRRVARPGQGEFLQCANPRCNYVRKNR